MSVVSSQTLVILDEAYFEYAQYSAWDYPDSMKFKYDNVITLRTFSKAYGIAGIRVGYGYAHPDLISALHKVKLPFEPSLIAQHAAIGAIKDYPHLERSLQMNLENMRKLREYLVYHNLDPINSVTNFISIPFENETIAQQLYSSLLDEGVIIRPLKANNLAHWLRISIGTKEEMAHLYEALDKHLLKTLNTYGTK